MRVWIEYHEETYIFSYSGYSFPGWYFLIEGDPYGKWNGPFDTREECEERSKIRLEWLSNP